MGISFKYAKRIAKTGTLLLIPLIVIDTAWALIEFILYNTVFGGTIPFNFDLIDNLTTNLLYTSFACVLATGMLMFSIYYVKLSRVGIVASFSIFSFIGVKIAFIIFRFIQLILQHTDAYMENTFYIFELITSLLWMAMLIFFDIFQRRLKSRADIGYGGSMFPYIFSSLGSVYPISSILSLFGVDYISNEIAFPIMRTIAFVASIFQILVLFDLLRRFSFMKSLEEVDLEKKIVVTEKKEEEK
jgi:hypothetical protein